jgi:hypothetical protein
MRQFLTEQAENCGIEWRERDPGSNQFFLNWHLTHDQVSFNPEVPTQSIFPRAFKAYQEDRISFWTENGQQFLTRPVESKISTPSTWITQLIR